MKKFSSIFILIMIVSLLVGCGAAAPAAEDKSLVENSAEPAESESQKEAEEVSFFSDRDFMQATMKLRQQGLS